MNYRAYWVRYLMSAAVLSGVIVISTPSGQSLISFNSGAASHVTSQFSAQIDTTVAGPGEHVTSTPSGTTDAQGNGQTATATVVSK